MLAALSPALGADSPLRLRRRALRVVPLRLPGEVVMARIVLLDRRDGTWRAAHETPERRVSATSTTPLQALGELHAALRARRQAIDAALAALETEGAKLAAGGEVCEMLECADERDVAPYRPDFRGGWR